MNLSRSKILMTALAGATSLVIASPVAAQTFGTLSGPTDPFQATNTGGPVDQNIQVNVNVGEGIGLDCQDSVTLGQIFGYGDGAGVVQCVVSTNNATGYTVTVSNMNSLVLTDGSGIPFPTPTATQQFTAFASNQADMTDATKSVWAVRYRDVITPRPWVGVGGVILQKNTPAGGAGDAFSIDVQAHTGQTNPVESGFYKGSFVATATTI